MSRDDEVVPVSGDHSAMVRYEAGWWIGWVQEVPGVNCQERSRPALMETLRITLREALALAE